MIADIYIDVPSPFGLSRPTRAWCNAIAEFDPELRIFPSQTHPLFRLMRCAHNTPVEATMDRMHAAMQKGILKEVHPDTRVAVQFKLVSVCTLPSAIVTASPEHVIQNLMARDQWKFKDGDAVADALDERDELERVAADERLRKRVRDTRKAAGISLLYRTGARVSLVNPSRHHAGAASSETPGGDTPAAVSPKG